MRDLAARALRPLSVLAPLACATFLVGLHVDSLAMRVASKPWIHLVLLAWIVDRGAGAYAQRIAAAIAVCMVADVVLEFRGAMFLAGMVVFLVAQLTLASAFAMRTRSPQPLAALPVASALGGAFTLVAPGLGAMTAPVMAYMAAIGTMIWRALAVVTVDPGAADEAARLGAAGAVVFGISDTMIALDRFHAPFAGARYAIILTYWAALALLAASAVRSSRR